MSAAEKLKALEYAPHPGYGPGIPTYESGELRYAKAETVMAALPQIVAVVEAAERFGDEDETAMAWANIKRELRAALSALDEALG